MDVSLETTTICIMSADGTIAKEAVVATKPEWIAIGLGMTSLGSPAGRRQ